MTSHLMQPTTRYIGKGKGLEVKRGAAAGATFSSWRSATRIAARPVDGRI